VSGAPQPQLLRPLRLPLRGGRRRRRQGGRSRPSSSLEPGLLRVDGWPHVALSSAKVEGPLGQWLSVQGRGRRLGMVSRLPPLSGQPAQQQPGAWNRCSP
jgi:hypothetical protein